MDKPNFIEVYNNVFDDTFCNTIIKEMDFAEKSGFASSRRINDGAEPLHKQDTTYFAPEEGRIEHCSSGISVELNNKLWEVAYKNYREKYNIISSLGPHNSYVMKVQKTKPGEGYHIWHCEADDRESSTRVLVWTVYLNDNFDAGETEFLYQQYRYKPKRGDVVIFPAAFTHTHRGNPPINGTKYIITGWIEF